jgi:hypothetical protein
MTRIIFDIYNSLAVLHGRMPIVSAFQWLYDKPRLAHVSKST